MSMQATRNKRWPLLAPLVLALAAAPRDGVTLLANRGVAGIDGTVSTAVGIALARPLRPTVALLGDLAFLHDVTGLVIGPMEPSPDLTLVVGNNDGGGIFHTLEPGAPEHASRFERVFGTPHGAVLADLARGAGWDHRLITDADELTAALSGAPTGRRVLEVPLDRTGLRRRHAALHAAALHAAG